MVKNPYSSLGISAECIHSQDFARADRVYSHELHLTHEYLGHMLGMRRSTVSVTAEELQRRKYIDYRRGRIKILNRSGLERTACECYRIVKVQAVYSPAAWTFLMLEQARFA